MSFLNGRVTYTRFRVLGDLSLPFGEDHLEKIERNAIGKRGPAETRDGASFGWSGGDHVLDVSFDLEKNIIDDALHAGIRIDADKIPGDLLRAYTKIETDARAALNPSGIATRIQKQEAKEAARLRAEAEAADGRFQRRKFYPILWDGRANAVYAGATSAAVLERVQTLFRETFDCILEPVTAGSLAFAQADAWGQGRRVEDLGPVSFVAEPAPAVVAWTEGDASSRDFWGNEFLLWLWHTLQSDGDTVQLPDRTEMSVMLAKTLTLDCPRGLTGRDNLTDEGPTRLPEAFRAIQSGKLPRKAGMILHRQGAQYELTLQAETLAVSGLALPKAEGAIGRDVFVARVESLRHLVESLDLLYDAYGRRRIGPDWTGELGRIRRWLQAA
jgi:hypothetical protein